MKALLKPPEEWTTKDTVFRIRKRKEKYLISNIIYNILSNTSNVIHSISKNYTFRGSSF